LDLLIEAANTRRIANRRKKVEKKDRGEGGKKKKIGGGTVPNDKGERKLLEPARQRKRQ